MKTGEGVTGTGTTEEARERLIGSLVVGAIGDALGANIEFFSWGRIQAEFGPTGVTGFVAGAYPAGAITDDTQMTLFTAEGLLRAATRQAAGTPADVTAELHGAYLRWLKTQDDPAAEDVEATGWLVADRRLWALRAPGNTCLQELASGGVGDLETRLNDSKGCGGVMRAAPAGALVDPAQRMDVGCRLAAITHSHPDGIAPAGALAVIVGALVDGTHLDDALDAAEEAVAATSAPGTQRLLRAGRELGARGVPDAVALERLGGGWVGDEALGIAVACAVGGADDPVAGLLASVNHSGDGDSTGAVTGNILGAALGRAWIPDEWTATLELRDVLEHMGDDLYVGLRLGVPAGENGAVDRDWLSRYPG